MANDVPVIEGLFRDTAEGPRLLGSRCAGCGVPYFPTTAICHNPDCDDSKIEDATFGPHGTIWSLAMQDYPPPPPAKYDEPYTPYTMGVVDLTDGLRVIGRISTDDPKSVEIGQKVELILDPICHTEDGNAVITWKFRPV